MVTTTLSLPADLSMSAIDDQVLSYTNTGSVTEAERDRYWAQVYVVCTEIIEGVTGGHWLPGSGELVISLRMLDRLDPDWITEVRERLAAEDWAEVWNEANSGRELVST